MSLPKYSEYSLSDNNNSGFGHSLTQKNSQKPPGSQQQPQRLNNNNQQQSQPDTNKNNNKSNPEKRPSDKNNSDNSKPDKGNKENRSKPSNNKSSNDPAAKRSNNNPKNPSGNKNNEKPSTTRPNARNNNPMGKDDLANRPGEGTRGTTQKPSTIYKAEEYKPKADIPKTNTNLPKVDNALKKEPEYKLDNYNSKGFQHSLGNSKPRPRPPPPKPQTVPREPSPPPPAYSPRPVTEYRRSPTPYYSPPPRRYTPLPPTPKRRTPSPPPAYHKDRRATYSWLSHYPTTRDQPPSWESTNPTQKTTTVQSAWPSPPPTTIKFMDRSDSRAQQKTPPPMPIRSGSGSGPKQPATTLEKRIQDILAPPRPEQLAPLPQRYSYGDPEPEEGPGGALIMHLAQLRNDDFSFLPDGPRQGQGQGKGQGDGPADADEKSNPKSKVPLPPTAKLDELSGLPPITGLFVDLPVRKFTELAPEFRLPPSSKDNDPSKNAALGVTAPGTSFPDVLSDFPTLYGVLLEPPVRTAAEVIPELKPPRPNPPSIKQSSSARSASSAYSPPSSIIFSSQADDSPPQSPTSPSRPDTLPLSPKILGKSDEMLQRGKYPTSILPNARPLPPYQAPKQSATLLPPPKPAPAAVATQTSPSPHLPASSPDQAHLPPIVEQPEVKPPNPNNRPLAKQHTSALAGPVEQKLPTPPPSKGQARPSVLRSAVLFKGDKQDFVVGVKSPEAAADTS